MGVLSEATLLIMFLNLFTLETFLNLRYMSFTMSKLDKNLATSKRSVDTKHKSATNYTIKANQKLFHEEQGRAQNNAADVETKNVSTKTCILLCNAWLCGIKLRCAKHILQRCGIRICTLR